MITEGPLVNGPFAHKNVFMDKSAAEVVAASVQQAVAAATASSEAADLAQKDQTFWKEADDHLIRVAAHWLPFVPVRADGVKLWVSGGRSPRCNHVAHILSGRSRPDHA